MPFLDNFKILQFDKNSSQIFAKSKAKLKKQGKIIADMDLMIASIAISNKAILYTNNLKHFNRIDGLKILWRISFKTASLTPQAVVRLYC